MEPQENELELEEKGKINGKEADIEAGKAAGAETLYPNMSEDPRLRWAFIRKVYSILTVQFLFTAGVAAVFTFIRPIPAFLLSNTRASWAVFILILLLPFFVMWPMMYFRKRHPINLIFLALYTLCMSASIGMACATTMGKFVLVAAFLTTSVLVGLTLYTFWAARRGHDFFFLHPFLLVSLLSLLVYLAIQIFWPLGRVALTIYGLLASIVFSAMIIYDTDNLIKRHRYEEYVCASIALYLDVANFFMSVLTFNVCH